MNFHGYKKILKKIFIIFLINIKRIYDVQGLTNGFASQESLSKKVAMFDQYADKHKAGQSKNPFTSGLNIEKGKLSKEEYGR